MNHPVRLKAEKLIRAGDIVVAEHALASLVETEGDDSLVVVLDDFPAKDLLAVLRDFDSSRESVVSLLVSDIRGVGMGCSVLLKTGARLATSSLGS